MESLVSVKNPELLLATAHVECAFVRSCLHLVALGEPALRGLRVDASMNFVRVQGQDFRDDVHRDLTEDAQRVLDRATEGQGQGALGGGILPRAETLATSHAVSYASHLSSPATLASLFHALVLVWCSAQYHAEVQVFAALRTRPALPPRRTRQARCALLVMALENNAVVEASVGTHGEDAHEVAPVAPPPKRRRRGPEGPAATGAVSMSRRQMGFLLRHGQMQANPTGTLITMQAPRAQAIKKVRATKRAYKATK